MIITPLGAAVEPEVYWRKASVSRSCARIDPAPGPLVRSPASSSVTSTVHALGAPARRPPTAARPSLSKLLVRTAAGLGVDDDGPQPRHRPVEPGR